MKEWRICDELLISPGWQAQRSGAADLLNRGEVAPDKDAGQDDAISYRM